MMRTAHERFAEAMALNELALRMKNRGWLVDQTKRAEHGVRLAELIKGAKEQFERISGIDLGMGAREFEHQDVEDDDRFDSRLFGSPKQLCVLFYDRWGCQRRINPKTGQVTVDKNVLKDLIADGPTPQVKGAARQLLIFREAHKTKSTYVDKLDPAHLNKKGEPDTYLTTGDGILHPTWQVVQAQTGRWSCSDPNLQNIQKPVYNEKKEVIKPGMRDMFLAKPGLTLVEGDYSQLELRIIALLAGDELLLQMYEDDRKLRLVGKEFDIHTQNAKILFGLNREPTSNERTLAKNFVYGSNYGGSAKTVWKVLVVLFPNLTVSDIQRMQDRWFKAHPWIIAFQRSTGREAKQTGKVIECQTGREFIFYMRQVKATEPPNYLVQGFAAALMNRAILRIDRALNWQDQEGCLAQIHDAAILEGRDKKRLAHNLLDNMTETVTMNGNSVPFPIDLKEGPCWGTMKGYKEAA